MNYLESGTPRARIGGMLLATALLSLAACGGGGKKNKAPVVDIAVSGDTHYELSVVQMNASASTDPEGKELSFSWSQTGGTSVSLVAADSATPSFETPKVESEETFTFELTVSDGKKETVASVDVIVLEDDWVVYSSEDTGVRFEHGVYLSPLDGVYLSPLVSGSMPVQLTTDVGEVNQLEVSADRRYVAFVMDYDISDTSFTQSLYVAPIGGEAVRVWDGNTDFEDTDGSGDGIGDGRIYFSWSPVGHDLAFVAQQLKAGGGTRSLANIMSWDAEAGISALTEIPFIDADMDGNADQTVDNDIAWSPRGEFIAYAHQYAQRFGYRAEVMSVPLDGSSDPVLVSDFSHDELSNAYLYVRGQVVSNADAEADGLDDMTFYGKSMPDSDNDGDGNPNGSVYNYGWLNDGRIYYIADTGPLRVYELHIANADGTGHQQVTSIGTTDSDGDRIADTDINADGLADGRVISVVSSPSGEMFAYRAAKQLSSRGRPLYREYIYPNGASPEGIEIVPDDMDLDSQSSGNYFWAPDESQLVFTEVQLFASIKFKSFVLEAGDVRLLSSVVSGTSLGQFLGWTADDSLVVKLDPPMSGIQVHILPLDGSGNIAVFSDGTFADYPERVSPTSEYMAFGIWNSATSEYDLGFVELTGNAEGIPVVRPDFDYWDGQWTPDGSRFVALEYDNAGGFYLLSAVDAGGSNLSENLTGAPSGGTSGVFDFEVFGPPAN